MHLYNALRQEGTLKIISHDLETIIDRQGAGRMFVGDLPKEPEHYLKRYLLGSRHSVTLLGSNPRKKEAHLSPKGARNLEIRCPMTQAFVERYCRNGQTIQWNCKDLPKALVLKEIRSGKTTNTQQSCTPGEDDGSKFFMDMIATVNRDPEDFRVIELGREKRSIQMQGFMTYLFGELQDESLDFTLDYLAVRRECWTALKKVEEACSKQLHKIYYASYLESNLPMFQMVGQLLQATAGSFDDGSLSKGKELTVSATELLQNAAMVFQEMIGSGAFN